MVSRSGLMWSPCSSTSSPTFTMAVSVGGRHHPHQPGEEPGGADPAADDRDAVVS